MTDRDLLDQVIADMRRQLEADQRGELPPAHHPAGAPIRDPQVAFFARMLSAPISPILPIPPISV